MSDTGVKRIIERLDSLIGMGEKVLATRYALTGNVRGPDRVEDALFRQWHTSSLAFLSTFPSGYVYAREFENHCKCRCTSFFAILKKAKFRLTLKLKD